MTQTKNTRPTFNNLRAGDQVLVRGQGSGGNEDLAVTFLGFSDLTQYGAGGATFRNLKAVKKWHGCKTLKDIEAMQDRHAYGIGIYAWFEDSEGGETTRWSAYLFDGRWCLGTSADVCRLAAIED